MSAVKPLVLYSLADSPNPLKVALVLEELGVSYEARPPPSDIKQEPFISLNPNGRLPALEDPNRGVVLFESGAIIEYLVRNYDPDGRLHYETDPQLSLTQSWLHFQMSGQGPYFGQFVWFKLLHPEKNIVSAIDRYWNEVKRVTGVIDAHLKKAGSKYLVGDRLTYADIAFVPWYNGMINSIVKDFDWKAEFPHFWAWFDALQSRESLKAVLAKKEFQRGQ